MPSGTSLPSRSSDRVARHQVADIAHQHQAAAGQGERAAVRRVIGAVRVEAPLDGPAALLQRGLELAEHQAQPVAIGRDLVLGVDRGDRILAVHDRGDRRLEHQVGDAGRIVLADEVAAVDADLGVQAVVDQQDGRRARGIAPVADELLRLPQPGGAALEADHEAPVLDGVAARVAMRALRERRGLVEEVARERHDLGAARRVVAAGPLGALVGDRVGAVEGIVEAAPARVGGVQRVARVHHRHDELRPRDGRDLGIDVGGRRRKVLALGHEVADFAQEALVGLEVEGSLVLPVPGVDLGLQLLAPRQQRAIARREIVDDRLERRPEARRVDARARQRLVIDEVVQDLGDPEAAGLDTRGHDRGCPSKFVAFGRRPRSRQPHPAICTSPRRCARRSRPSARRPRPGRPQAMLARRAGFVVRPSPTGAPRPAHRAGRRRGCLHCGDRDRPLLTEPMRPRTIMREFLARVHPPAADRRGPGVVGHPQATALEASLAARPR